MCFGTSACSRVRCRRGPRSACQPAVILDGRNPETIVVSPEDGMWEAMLEPGDAVREGEPVGRLWFIDRPDRPAEPILAPLDGVVAVTKAIPVTEQGDCVSCSASRSTAPTS